MIRSLLWVALVGCGPKTGSLAISAPTSAHAISLTPYLSDSNGVVDAARVAPVGRFFYETEGCVEGDLDISAAVNAQVAAQNADAVVGLSLEGRGRGTCIWARVHGTLVTVRP